MAKRRLARRPSRTWLAKGDYYPKVDLSDVEGRPPSSWSPSSVVTPAEETADEQSIVAAESARAEEEVMPPPVAVLDSPVSPPKPTPALAPLVPPPSAAAAGAFSLPGSLDLPAARPLASALLARRGQPIVIDGSAVVQIGAQCAQVLLSAKRTWETDGVALSIVNCAARMIEDLKLIGIDRTMLAIGDLPQ